MNEDSSIRTTLYVCCCLALINSFAFYFSHMIFICRSSPENRLSLLPQDCTQGSNSNSTKASSIVFRLRQCRGTVSALFSSDLSFALWLCHLCLRCVGSLTRPGRNIYERLYEEESMSSIAPKDICKVCKYGIS